MTNTREFAARLFALALIVVGLALPAAAQAPKVSPKPYNRADYGFRVKTPAEWMLIPAQPGEQHVLAKFKPENVEYVQVGTSNPPTRKDIVFLQYFVLVFDRRKTEEATKEKSGAERFKSKPLKDVAEWLKKGNEIEFAETMKLAGEKELRCEVPAKEYEFATPGEEKTSHKVYAAVYSLAPDLDVAIVGTGPGATSKWTKFSGAYQQMARSFGRIDAADEIATPVGATLRDRERAKLQKAMASQGGGWKLYETPNYFVLTPHEDRAFVEELLGRLEAIHAIYEEHYPAAMAEEYRKAGKAARTGETAEERRKREAEEAMAKEVFGDGDPREMARCSVVRVFTDQGAYHAYGGPGGSAGYWSAFHRELVIYDDQKGGGRRDTWAVLNHEAFHQYIFYFYGNISPHSWYNEGTGDFYSGYQYKNKRFHLEKFDWRTGTIKEAVRDGAETPYIPLKDFVRLTQGEYYGQNKWNVDGGQNYAQGWSFIYFLRAGKKGGAKDWNPAWDTILDTYLRVLATSGDLDQAVTEAFQGIDFDALERSWREFTK